MLNFSAHRYDTVEIEAWQFRPKQLPTEMPQNEAKLEVSIESMIMPSPSSKYIKNVLLTFDQPLYINKIDFQNILANLKFFHFLRFLKVGPQLKMPPGNHESSQISKFSQVEILKVWARVILTPPFTQFPVAESIFHTYKLLGAWFCLQNAKMVCQNPS